MDSAEYDRRTDEMCDEEEAFVEELAAKATRDQQAGREKAERVQEEALEKNKTNSSVWFFQRKNTEPESVGTAVVMYIRRAARPICWS